LESLEGWFPEHVAHAVRAVVRAADTLNRCKGADYFPPLKELHPDTDAFELLYTDTWGTTKVLNNDGACWIDRHDAEAVRLKEQSIKITKDRVLTVLWFQNLP
jgi:hypothetical protein